MNSTSAHEVVVTDSRLSAVWTALESITDPEIPVLSLREMGILREVRRVPEVLLHSDAEPDIEVVITPTYNGCPAMDQIKNDVLKRLGELGIQARLVVQMAPAWTTDWMSATAHSKLRAYGIAPPNGQAPVMLASDLTPTSATSADTSPLAQSKRVAYARRAARSLTAPSAPCPRCGSPNTTETSHFGSTACKALYRCLACMEPFDHFKPH